MRRFRIRLEFGISRSTALYFGYGTKNVVNIHINANRLRLDFCWAVGLSQVDADIERHMAVCMDCRCVLPMRRRPTWEDLAVMFEGSTASGAERAYKV